MFMWLENAPVFGVDEGFIDGSSITVFVNDKLMPSSCNSWLTDRFTGILAPVERNQRMNVDLITQNHP